MTQSLYTSLRLLLVPLLFANVLSESIALPPFSFDLTVDDNVGSLPPTSFRDNLIDVTTSHLEFELSKELNKNIEKVEEDGVVLHWVELNIIRMGLRHAGIYEGRVDIETIFDDGLVMANVHGQDIVLTEERLKNLVIKAFSGDAYWGLLRRFSGDELLQYIYDIQIYVDSVPARSTVIHDNGITTTTTKSKNGGNDSLWYIIVLAVMATVLALAVLSILLFMYRRGLVKDADGEYHSKGSASTCEEQHSSDSEGDDEEDSGTPTMTPTPPLVPKRRRRRQRVERQRLNTRPSGLAIISEGDNDDDASSIASNPVDPVCAEEEMVDVEANPTAAPDPPAACSKP